MRREIYMPRGFHVVASDEATWFEPAMKGSVVYSLSRNGKVITAEEVLPNWDDFNGRLLKTTHHIINNLI